MAFLHKVKVRFLDKDNKPLGRAILSSDQRAYEIVQCWQKENILQNFYPITLQTLWMGHPVSILRWIKEMNPVDMSKFIRF